MRFVGRRVRGALWLFLPCCCVLWPAVPTLAAEPMPSGAGIAVDAVAPARRHMSAESIRAGDPLLQAALTQPPPSLAKLARLAREAEAISLTAPHGMPDVSLIRQRLARLEAIRSESSAALHAGSLTCRLQARLIVAWAHGRFASALEALPMPASANTGAARAAWTEQRDIALREVRLHAAAHLRSCLALGQSLPHAPPAYRSSCARLLGSIPDADGAGNFAAELPRDPGALVRLRSPELSACIAHAARRTRDLLPDRIVARLELNAAGVVQKALLEGELGSEALKACLDQALKLWAFPGLSDVAIEVPIQLRVRAD